MVEHDPKAPPITGGKGTAEGHYFTKQGGLNFFEGREEMRIPAKLLKGKTGDELVRTVILAVQHMGKDHAGQDS